MRQLAVVLLPTLAFSVVLAKGETVTPARSPAAATGNAQLPPEIGRCSDAMELELSKTR